MLPVAIKNYIELLYSGSIDKAIIFGEELPVNEIAADLQTIPYEVLTSIGQRVKRIYYKE
jgi:alanine racemase